MAEHNLDALVIGGGPGGYTAAIRLSQLGFEVGIAERDELGGVCLNWGCIPTKSLLHTADVMREVRSAHELGLELGEPSFDLEKVVQRSRDVAGQLSGGISHLMRKNKIAVFRGDAKFESKNIVHVGNETVIADNVILATGAAPRNLPDIKIDGDRIWDARTAMTPAFMPRRLLIIGAGAIGVEFASFYATMGAEVTLCGPSTLVPPFAEELGVKVNYNVDELIEWADAINVLRIQRERMKGGLLPSIREYRNLFGITKDRLSKHKKEIVIMHPGPMNRGVEIDSVIADSDQAIILDQVLNGVASRMAILYLLLGGNPEEESS